MVMVSELPDIPNRSAKTDLEYIVVLRLRKIVGICMKNGRTKVSWSIRWLVFSGTMYRYRDVPRLTEWYIDS